MGRSNFSTNELLNAVTKRSYNRYQAQTVDYQHLEAATTTTGFVSNRREYSSAALLADTFSLNKQNLVESNYDPFLKSVIQREWTDLLADLVGDNAGDDLGRQFSLSSDGTKLAVLTDAEIKKYEFDATLYDVPNFTVTSTHTYPSGSVDVITGIAEGPVALLTRTVGGTIFATLQRFDSTLTPGVSQPDVWSGVQAPSAFSSSDGNRVALFFPDQGFRIYDGASYYAINAVTESGVMSRNGLRIVTLNGTYDVPSATPTQPTSLQRLTAVPRISMEKILCLTFDGNVMVAKITGVGLKVYVWTGISWKETASLPTNEIADITLDARYIVTAGNSNVTFFRLVDGSYEQYGQTLTHGADSVSINQNGDRVVLGQQANGNSRVYALGEHSRWLQRTTIQDSGEGKSGCAKFANDGKSFLTASDRVIRVSQASLQVSQFPKGFTQTGNAISTPSATSISSSDDGVYTAAAFPSSLNVDGSSSVTFKVYRLGVEHGRVTLTGSGSSVAVSPDGTKFAAGVSGTVRVFTTSGTTSGIIRLKSTVNSITLTPQSSLFAMSGDASRLIVHRQGGSYQYEVYDDGVVRGGINGGNALDLTNDGNFLAVRTGSTASLFTIDAQGVVSQRGTDILDTDGVGVFRIDSAYAGIRTSVGTDGILNLASGVAGATEIVSLTYDTNQTMSTGMSTNQVLVSESSEITGFNPSSYGIEISRDGSKMVVYDGTSIGVYSRANSAWTFVRTRTLTNCTYATLAPDGNRLAYNYTNVNSSGFGSPMIKIENTVDGTSFGTISGFAKSVAFWGNTGLVKVSTSGVKYYGYFSNAGYLGYWSYNSISTGYSSPFTGFAHARASGQTGSADRLIVGDEANQTVTIYKSTGLLATLTPSSSNPGYGKSVDISGDGTKIAISAPDQGRGYIRIMTTSDSGSTWAGGIIHTPPANPPATTSGYLETAVTYSRFGKSVAMSSDGLRIAYAYDQTTTVTNTDTNTVVSTSTVTLVSTSDYPQDYSYSSTTNPAYLDDDVTSTEIVNASEGRTVQMVSMSHDGSLFAVRATTGSYDAIVKELAIRTINTGLVDVGWTKRADIIQLSIPLHAQSVLSNSSDGNIVALGYPNAIKVYDMADVTATVNLKNTVSSISLTPQSSTFDVSGDGSRIIAHVSLGYEIFDNGVSRGTMNGGSDADLSNNGHFIAIESNNTASLYGINSQGVVSLVGTSISPTDSADNAGDYRTNTAYSSTKINVNAANSQLLNLASSYGTTTEMCSLTYDPSTFTTTRTTSNRILTTESSEITGFASHDGIVISRDGGTLAVYDNAKFSIYNYTNSAWTFVRTKTVTSGPYLVVLSHDGSRVAYRDGSLKVENALTGASLGSISVASLYTYAFKSNTSLALLQGTNDIELYDYDGTNWSLGETISYSGTNSSTSLLWSGDGTRLAAGDSGSNRRVSFFEYDSTLTAPVFSLVQEGSAHTASLQALSGTGDVKVLGTSTGVEIHEASGTATFTGGAATSIDVSIDGTRVVVGTSSKMYVVHKSAGVWTQLGSDITGNAPRVAISRDGSKIFSNDLVLKSYEYVSGSWTTYLPDLTVSGITKASTDGDIVAVGTDVYSKQSVTTSAGYTFNASGSTFSGTEQAVSGNGNVRVVADKSVNSSTGQALIYEKVGGSWSSTASATFTGASATEEFGRDVDVSNDGTRVVVGSGTKMAVVEKSGGTWSQLGSDISGSTMKVAISRDGSKVFAYSGSDMKSYELVSGSWTQYLPDLTGLSNISRLSPSTDGDIVALMKIGSNQVYSKQSVTTNGTTTDQYDTRGSSFGGFQFDMSDDGSKVVSMAYQKTSTVWNGTDYAYDGSNANVGAPWIYWMTGTMQYWGAMDTNRTVYISGDGTKVLLVANHAYGMSPEVYIQMFYRVANSTEWSSTDVTHLTYNGSPNTLSYNTDGTFFVISGQFYDIIYDPGTTTDQYVIRGSGLGSGINHDLSDDGDYVVYTNAGPGAKAWNGSSWAYNGPAATNAGWSSNHTVLALSGDATKAIAFKSSTNEVIVYTKDAQHEWSENVTLTQAGVTALSIDTDGSIVGVVANSQTKFYTFGSTQSPIGWYSHSSFQDTAEPGFAQAFDISNDGDAVVVGVSGDGTSSYRGAVRVYDYTSSWAPRSTITPPSETASNGNVGYRNLGKSVSISSDGTKIAYLGDQGTYSGGTTSSETITITGVGAYENGITNTYNGGKWGTVTFYSSYEYFRLTYQGSNNNGIWLPVTFGAVWSVSFEWYLNTANGADDMRFVFYAPNQPTSYAGSQHGGYNVFHEYYGGDEHTIRDPTDAVLSTVSTTYQSNSWRLVSISYNNGVLTTSVNGASGTSRTYTFTGSHLSAQQALWGTNSYIAITGRTGGVSATQYIKNINVSMDTLTAPTLTTDRSEASTRDWQNSAWVNPAYASDEVTQVEIVPVSENRDLETISMSYDGTRFGVRASSGSYDAIAKKLSTQDVIDTLTRGWTKRGDIISFDTTDSIAATTSRSMRSSVDGNTVAFGYVNSSGVKIRVYTFASGSWSQLGSEISTTGTTISMDVSNDGMRLAVISDDTARVFAYDGTAWTPFGSSIAFQLTGVHTIKISGDGNYVALGNSASSNTLLVYNKDVDWNLISPTMTSSANFFGAGFGLLDDGSQLVNYTATGVEFSSFYIGVIPTPPNQRGSDITFVGTTISMDVSNDGTRLAVISDDTARVFAYDGTAWAQLGSSIAFLPTGVDTVKISGDGNFIALGNNAPSDPHPLNALRVYRKNADWDLVSPTMTLAKTPSNFFGAGFGLRDDGSQLVHYTDSGVEFSTFTTSTTNISLQHGTDITGNGVGSNLALDNSGNTLVTSSFTDHAVRVYDANGNLETSFTAPPSYVKTPGGDQLITSKPFSITKDGNKIVTVITTGEVAVYKKQGGTWSQDGNAVTVTGGRVSSLDITNDGQRIIVGNVTETTFSDTTGKAQVFDLADGVWSQVGADILPLTEEDHRFANVVAVSDTGYAVVSGQGAHNSGQPLGIVQSYELRTELQDLTFRAPTIELVGNSYVKLSFGEEYTELGATIDTESAIVPQLKISGKVSTGVVGTYTIRYECEDLLRKKAAPIFRQVDVMEELQTFGLIGDSVVYHTKDTAYVDAGVDISGAAGYYVAPNSLVAVPGVGFTPTLVGDWKVVWANQNIDKHLRTGTMRTRTVRVRARPVVTLTGDLTIFHVLNENYQDPGVTVDVGTVTATQPNVRETGVYTLTYTAVDAFGIEALPVTRTVNVKEKPSITAAQTSFYNILSDPISVPAPTVITPEGYASDLTPFLQSSNTIDINTRGDYTIAHTLTDSDGISADPFTQRFSVGSHGSLAFSKTGSVFALSRNGGDLAVFDTTIKTYRVQGFAQYGDVATPAPPTSIKFTPDGQYMVVGMASHLTIGLVRVYKKNVTFSSGWEQVGFDLFGTDYLGKFGESVDINTDATRVVVGVPEAGTTILKSGKVKIYDWTGFTWNEAKVLEGTNNPTQFFGFSVSFDNEGKTLAVGSPGLTKTTVSGTTLTTTNIGKASVYKLSGSDWQLSGSEIEDGTEGKRNGTSVSLSRSGNVLAVGSVLGGGVRVYSYSTDWTLYGSHVQGSFGESVSLSSNGNTLVAGSKDENKGRVYKYTFGGDGWSRSTDTFDTIVAGEGSTTFLGKKVSLDGSGELLCVSSNTDVRIYLV